MIYSPKADHRQPSASRKSQWTISAAEEQSCFALAISSAWSFGNALWSVYAPAGPAVWLGLSQAPDRAPVFIAKFVEDQAVWHGYPVAHWKSKHDKPSSKILLAWRENGYIRRQTVSRVVRGKKCKP